MLRRIDYIGPRNVMRDRRHARTGQQRLHVVDVGREGVAFVTERFDLVHGVLPYGLPAVTVVLADQFAQHAFREFFLVVGETRFELVQAVFDFPPQRGEGADVRLEARDDFPATREVVAEHSLVHAGGRVGTRGLEGRQPVVIPLSLGDQGAHFFDGHDVRLRQESENTWRTRPGHSADGGVSATDDAP